jgi:hypothetical protein
MLRFLSEAMIQELQKLYPRKRYGPQDDIGFIMFHEGRQSVIDDLRALHEKESTIR